MKITSVVVAWMLLAGEVAALGLDVTLQKPFGAVGSWPAVSLQLTRNSKWQPIYFSSGVVMRPGPVYVYTHNSPSTFVLQKTHSFYGVYAGTFVGFAPIFRPGVIAGISWKKEQVIGKENGRSFVKGYIPFQINPYFGFEVHCLIMSFVITNEGFGAGINLNIGKSP